MCRNWRLKSSATAPLSLLRARGVTVVSLVRGGWGSRVSAVGARVCGAGIGQVFVCVCVWVCVFWEAGSEALAAGHPRSRGVGTLH